MSNCAINWDLTLTLDRGGASPTRDLKFEITDDDDSGRVPNRITGVVKTAAGANVSPLVGSCRLNPATGLSVMSCIFYMPMVQILMHGVAAPTNPPRFIGVFSASSASVPAGGTAFADPGDTGTSGGQQTTFIGSASEGGQAGQREGQAAGEDVEAQAGEGGQPPPQG